ncbi:MAG: hypothetical protein KDC53_17720 [Saprospiraceae bacterium]|nr:hypothetical protein [Saprospiraceae bacterium]
MQWNREDDIKHDFYQAISAQRIKAVLDGENKLTGWNHHISFPSIGSTSDDSADCISLFHNLPQFSKEIVPPKNGTNPVQIFYQN